MLRFRGISALHLCVLLALLSASLAQYYNPDYRVQDDLEHADRDHARYTGSDSGHGSETSADDDRPDYSKYYKKDGASASLLAGAQPGGFLGAAEGKDSGFVTPLDFSGFFGASQFGAETNQKQSLPVIPLQNPFHFQDALKKQNTSGFVDASDFTANFAAGPNFEHEVGQHFNNNPFEQKADNTYIAPKDTSYKSNTKPQSYKSEVDDLNGYEAPRKNLEYAKPLPKQNNNYKFAPIVPTLSSYNGGKINHLAPVKTYVPQLFPATKLTNAPLNIQSTLTPYLNYNFQPTAGLPKLGNIKSTLPPLNSYNVPSTSGSYYAGSNDFASPTEYAQPSEYKSQKVQNSNCQQVEKQLSPEDISHGRFRRQADKMNCFMCKDAKTGGTYEQCSYTSDPEDDKSYFRGHAEKYSTKKYTNPEEHSRKRRDADKKDKRNKRKRNDEKEEYVNPYNYDKNNQHDFNSKPKEFDDTASYYQAPDFSHYEKDSENYKFGPEYFSDDTTEEKSYSELQSDELKKNGANCKKIKKDSLTCMICANPKTGGNYEQCSYTSEPNEKKYAYVKEKKYNSNDPDPEEKTVESTETKPQIQRNKSRYQKPSVEFSASTKHPKQVKNYEKDDDYFIPHHFISETKQQKKRFGKSESDNDKNKEGDYVYKLFPEYAEKESKNREVKQRPGFEYKSDLPEYFTAEESKKDVDSVLQEFTKKDRSKCKKIAKDKMTCYICVDDKGIQHEECMFVSESQPVSSHIAYHEVKEFSSDPKRQNNDEETAGSNQAPELKLPREPKRKTKKVNSTPVPIKEVDAEPTEYVKIVGKKPRIVRRKTNISKDYLGNTPQESKRSEVKVENPQSGNKERQEEEGPDGAYASELVPVYSKTLGMTLPKYMLDITEGEKVFDDVVKSG